MAVDRAALEVAMQINTGSIERDCPERAPAKERKGWIRRSEGEEKRRKWSNVRERRRNGEREEPQGRGFGRAPERVNGDKKTEEERLPKVVEKDDE